MKPRQRLMRVVYATDATDEDLTYQGAFSEVFPAEEFGRRILAVDWSVRGQVEITWLVAGN